MYSPCEGPRTCEEERERPPMEGAGEAVTTRGEGGAASKFM